MSSDDWSYTTAWSLYGDSRAGVSSTSWSQFLAGAYVTWVDSSVGPGASSGTSGTSGTSDGVRDASSSTNQWELTFSSKGEERTAVSPTGSTGWFPLPVVESGARSGERFLGWSTSATFPVEVAIEQIENGWGAIDAVIDGQRMIFIPAGAWTQISGSNHFYAVWG